jgi:hypothetical protein
VKTFFWSLLLTLFLAACQPSLIAELTVPSGGILYKDDFSDATSGWPRVVSANGSEDYNDGSYRIEVNIPQYDLWATPSQTFEDVKVEEDATRLGGPDANRFGLVCRYHDPQNFYFFIISSDGYFAIGKTVNGRTSLLGQEMMAYSPVVVQGEGPNHIRFDCISSALTGYVNGQALASASDADFHNGDVGLIAGAFNTGGVKIAFTNFIVRKP